MTTPITLAALDLAGTTVRDDGAVEQAFLAALDAAGVGEDDPRRPRMLDYVVETMGSSKITVFEALFPDDATLPPLANSAFEAAYEKMVAAGEVEAMEGAASTIADLRAAGTKVALCTGFSRATRDALIAALGWETISDLLVCPQDAGRGRPYPDMVLWAMLRLGIDDVASVAVVGDTAADIATGRRAGASIVAGVLTGADDRGRLETAGATAILESIRDLPALIARG